jgi:hypothetical protein
MNQRRILSLLGTATVPVTSGRSSSVGTVDMTVRNCQPDTRDVDIRVARNSSGSVIYTDTYEVSGDSYSDVRAAPVEVEDLFNEPGEYHVEVNSPDLAPTERDYTFDEALIETNDDSVTVRIEEEGLVLN